MNASTEILDSAMNVAKDVHAFNAKIVKAGIDGLDDLSRGIVDEVSTNKMEDAIRKHLDTSFKNWQIGHNWWLNGVDALYEPGANINMPMDGSMKRFTLQEYKDVMARRCQYTSIEFCQIDNMIIDNEWAALRYTIAVKNMDSDVAYSQQMMEFVKFKDRGKKDGVRIVEAWLLSDQPLS